MHRNSRHDTMFAFHEHQLGFSGQGYSERSYPSAPNSSSEYWNYTSSYSSQNGPFTYASQKHLRPWSNDVVAGQSLESSSLPRSVNSYDASFRSTDLRQTSIYSSSMDMWPSQWSESRSNVSHPSWSNIPSIDAHETKPIITHHHLHLPMSSCSPLSTISSPSPSPSPVETSTSETSKLGRRPSASGFPKMCSHCHATSTPLWRREPTTFRTLCNACGLYLQQRNKLRPKELIEADLDDESEGS
ncbi:hypothetical protein BT96DRAFT_637144 [Gymnopus androsaceus JB14]|uniref:GATA-type domain-containing protein n=1 Tax=Gymnopus androsaceus JB14 TaxID=1447944 RepID=A0A6A4GGJ0_9AGAR|nr:hypothetical protein BT96DRAFT_637144 [Gymnopus androsaceus JB14]